MKGENLEAEETARQHFLSLKRVLNVYRKGQYTDENVLNYFAGFCEHVPKPEDLKFEDEILATGRCPDCGALMVKRHFVDTWDAYGTPSIEGDDWYCVWCKMRWQPDDAVPAGEER